MSVSSSQNPRAVIFDVGGTLYVCPALDALVEEQANVVLATARDCTVEEAKELLRAQRAENKEKHGDPSKVRALESLGVPGGAFQDAAAALDPAPLLNGAPPVGPLLTALREMGVEVGVLSNFKESLVRKVFACLGADWSQVDASVCVEDGLPIKPDPAPFGAICGRLRVEPREAVFVGDSVAKDLTPAKRLGMTTVLVESGELDGDSSVVDHRVASADGVLDLLSL
jgi:putative hydrolase of the HAD superfamily